MWNLKIVKGAELADKPVLAVRLPQPLQRFSIGRDPANPWALADRTLAVSARHCEIVDTPAGPALRDLSTNGTFVNGATTRLNGPHLLRHGDRFELGPFVVEVVGPPMPAPPPTLSAPPATPQPARSPGVLDTAPLEGSGAQIPPRKSSPPPLRGGDPAAMMVMGTGAAPAGLTEILRVAPAAEDSGVDMTKIRLAPPAASTAAQPAPAPGAPPAVAASVPPRLESAASTSMPTSVAAAPVSEQALCQALARGLGLPTASLANHDPLLLAEHLALSARAAVAALRQLQEQQAQTRRALGSRQSLLAPVQGAPTLHRAASAEGALLALALATTSDETVAVIQRCAADLCAHQERLLQALRGAARGLGAQLAPEALQSALPDAGVPTPAQQARLWELYTGVWRGLGRAPSQGWAAGFEEAVWHHLAAAYDAAHP